MPRASPGQAAARRGVRRCLFSRNLGAPARGHSPGCLFSGNGARTGTAPHVPGAAVTDRPTGRPTGRPTHRPTAQRIPNRSRSASLAAHQPFMPCTAGPGGVALEQR
ncbi:hypothetical protein GCM10009750_01690 [Agromyces salentinus]|uniref:Uncharacterized protein n=1 Tax=Agromyces salentinus TaxID=269421 RepID=A0ABN2MEC6_9MICO